MVARASAFQNFPAIGISQAQESRFLRVDFKVDDFDSLIETKSPRLAWARATICPCQGFSEKTKQADPSCTKCNGVGWRYFRPRNFVAAASVGTLDALQTALIERAKACVIRGVVVGIGNNPDMFQALGNWAWGSAQVSVRAPNKLGYYDRLVQLDDVMPFSEVITVDGNTLTMRYPPLALDFLASDDVEFTDDDVTLDDSGVVTWKTGKRPAASTRVTAHYLCHPVWVVIEHANLVRSSSVKRRVAHPQTPLGSHIDLPVRAIIRREHLPMDPDA